jgi:hypothetical protein
VFTTEKHSQSANAPVQFNHRYGACCQHFLVPWRTFPSSGKASLHTAAAAA